MTGKRVLISGASIAGPALAYWLDRYGWNPTVIERAPELRSAGQNIDIRGAGRDVVRRMGIEDAIREATTGEQGTLFVTGTGRAAAASPAGDSDSGGATAELEILRDDLARILVDRTLAATEYIFGNTITGIDDYGDEVTVSFEHGADRAFDLVVVAEGKNSRTRALALDDTAIRRLGLYTAYLTIPRTGTDSGWARWYNAPGGRALILRPDNKGTTRAALSFLSRRTGYDDRTREQQIRLLRHTFRDAGWEVPRVLDTLDQATDMYFEDIGQVKAPSWSRGRAALVGDAAYCASPISGMGTSLALVGAYVLAGELGAHVHHSDAFRAYRRIMQPYVDQAQKLPPGAPRIANPKTRIGIGVLHAVLRVGTTRAFGIIGDTFFTPPADAIDLPDYSHLVQHRR